MTLKVLRLVITEQESQEGEEEEREAIMVGVIIREERQEAGTQGEGHRLQGGHPLMGVEESQEILPVRDIQRS